MAWQVLGEDVLYLEMGDVWKRKMLELTAGKEYGARFAELVGPAEVRHMFNGTTERHAFMIEFEEEEASPEDVQLLADAVLDIAKEDLDRPFVSLDGEYQKCEVVITSEKEPELIGLDRTDGYASGKIFQPIVESLTRPGRARNCDFD